MHQQRNHTSSTMKNHSNTVPQKETGNSPQTKLTVMKYCDLTEKEFKIVVMQKLNKLQENSESQINELRNKINEQKKYFTRDIKTLKKSQTGILELKN